MNSNFEILHDLLKKNKSEVFLIHPDLFRFFILTKNTLDIDFQINRNFYLKSHIDLISNILDEREIWFPAFNFNFLKKGIFEIENSVCDRGGPLSEYYRKFESSWRTFDPVFSISGRGKNPFPSYPARNIIAYDEKSFFSELIKKDGSLFCYGAKPSTLAHIHFIEKQCQVPYRYKKYFKGLIISKSKKYNVSYEYYVRPSLSLVELNNHNYAIEYDWKKILQIMHENRVIESSKNGVGHVIKARDFVDLLSKKINSDPLYLLEKNSYEWISKKLEKLGRAFDISDFE